MRTVAGVTGVEITGPDVPRADDVLTPAAPELVAVLHRELTCRRLELIAPPQARVQALAAGESVRAAHYLREARSQPGHGRHPEAMSLWSQLYVRLPRQTFQGGWGGATCSEHGEAVTSVCLSADGRLALSGSADRTLKLWEPASGRCLHTFEGDMGGVTSVCLNADGRLALSGSIDATLKLWDVRDGHCLRTCREDLDVLTSVALSADGLTLASGSVDQTIKLWNAQTGHLLRTLTGHTHNVRSVALSADGLILASGSDDQTIKLWNTQTGKLLQDFLGHHWVESAGGFVHKQQLCAAGHRAMKMRVGRADPEEDVERVRILRDALGGDAGRPQRHLLVPGPGLPVAELLILHESHLAVDLDPDAVAVAMIGRDVVADDMAERPPDQLDAVLL